MFPFIIHYKNIYIPTFFFMIMVASLATTFYCYWQAGRKHMSQIAILDISLFGTMVGIVGARLFHVFVEAPQYYWEDPIRVFYFWQGGFVGYGAFIGVALSAIIYLKMKKLSVLEYGDLVALGCPLIIFFVRVGCVGAGCCYGKPTDFPIHFVFHNPASDGGHDFPGQKLHATQIYDMMNAIFTFIVLHIVDKRKKFSGQLILIFFSMYAFFRFFIEFLRGDEDRGVYFNKAISTSQITGLVILAICTILYFFLRKNGRQKTL
ncbi:MAG: hypothetical protein A3G32_10135 [Deltaproteobacteria bacterium RIFCSPLOWO2_12_FULL_40_28]|nr:MAG: hypothetical protein A3C45_05145 [Deltaproteobacteria bacterium RIFCSPHIGHO2_02_FULL_40_28]OGQ20387.1 MAG: hypothetical protein A3E27_00525 [Deltaproteobacteria bacterium RIFCSPHIGHO2_12_FULL_40_32]OGQ41356.1 MAG: hypothetical protein A3I69_02175 [Deltaproteobacteria bacterium RIFCSPLOWO2_02_FULL_40_36]OGQ54995.1 MAG: hypothetical protein A3G32_10135 [Deltaproteobacteria bacterium RIFCSPLOWO2_12_FULL_40_28]